MSYICICHKKCSPWYYRSHIVNVHASDSEFICDICGASYKSNVYLNNHKRLHLERKFPCTLCNKKYIRKADLKEHMRFHTGEQPYACDLGGKGFTRKGKLNYHMQNHAGIKRKCMDCGKEFNKITQLKIHSYKHTAREFEREANVKVHEKRMHLHQKPRTKECSVCHKHIETQNFSKHMANVHGPGRNFVCDICGCAYKSQIYLKAHRRLHVERTLPCTLCDKKFVQPKDVRVHMRVHTGERAFPCEICDKRFKSRGHLTYHLQEHAGVKRKCEICGQEFSKHHQLKKHSFTHTGMPFQCTLCSYGCVKREAFKTHLLRAHNKTMTDEEYTVMRKVNTGRILKVQESQPEEAKQGE